ncbi:MAG: fibronectin type III domain-containing protein [Acidiferrobacterales bacterium]|nr:fibronectin type III domain-containing protein [Acidiferrobacterales bacterium]
MQTIYPLLLDDGSPANEIDPAFGDSPYLNFDGTADYVSMGTIDIAGSALTIESWFNSADLENCASVDCRIVSKSNGTAETQHYWMLSTIGSSSGPDVVLRFRLKIGGVTSTLIAAAGLLSENTWYHAAAVYDGSQMRLYLNGLLVGSATKSGSMSQNSAIPVWVGGNPEVANQRPWNGYIDEVRIWSTARTQNQIATNAYRQINPNESGLVAYYRFDEGSGQAISDSAGDHHTYLGSSLTVDENDPSWSVPDTEPPTAPTNLQVSNAASNSIDISWMPSSDNSGVAFYEVLRDNLAVAQVDASDTMFSDIGLIPNTSYHYAVAAVDSSGNRSDNSSSVMGVTGAPDSAAPSTPANFNVSDPTATSLRLSWNASTDTGGSGLLRYNIFYADGSLAGTVIHPTLSYIDSGLSPEASYSYYITAVDGAENESAVSSTVSGTTLELSTSSWEAATASNDMNQILAWYQTNTGFDGVGCVNPTLGRVPTAADLTTYTGPSQITVDGTVIENKRISGSLIISADNVTIRNSVIDINGAYSYAIAIGGNPSLNYGSNWNVHCVTIENSVYESSQNYEDRGNRVMHITTPGTARYIKNLDGFGSGINGQSSGMVLEYNYIEHIVRSPGSHNTSMGLRSQGAPLSNFTIRRNLLRDGTSSAFSFYTRAAGLHENILIQENIFDLPHTTSTNYCVNYDGKHPAYPSYTMSNVLYDSNIFGQSNGSAVCGSSGPRNGGCDLQSGPGICEITNERYIDGNAL